MLAGFIKVLRRLLLEDSRSAPMIVDRGEDTPSLILANMVCAELLSFTGTIERRTENDPSSDTRQKEFEDFRNKIIKQGASHSIISVYEQEHYRRNSFLSPRYPRHHWKFVMPKCTVKGYSISAPSSGSSDYLYIEYHTICPGVCFDDRERKLIEAAVRKAFEYEGRRAELTKEQTRQEQATQAMEKWLGIGKFGASSLEDMSLKSN